MKDKILNKSTLSWALYDWANSAFATTVMAGFFPLFFKLYLSEGTPPEQSTAKLGVMSSVVSLMLGLLSPILGSISDYKSYKKEFLFFFMCIGIGGTACLYIPGKGDWVLASIFYAFGLIGFTASIVFYEALLPGISNSKTVDRISALGYSLGYLGGGVLFALNVFMFQKPQLFDFADGTEAIKFSFISVAIWWAVFSIPVLLYVREPRTLSKRPETNVIAEAFRQVFKTIKKAPKLPTLFLFLAAYWLYCDALNTVIKMAVDYGLSIGLKSSDLIAALLITQFVGFPAAYIFGMTASRFSPKSGILFGIAVYLVAIVVAIQMQSSKEFYILAVLIGCVQGGVQSLSRSLFSRFVPEEQSGEFFALFNIVGRFAAIIGPLLVAGVGLVFQNPRYGVGSISILFIIGATLLLKVDMQQGEKEKLSAAI